VLTMLAVRSDFSLGESILDADAIIEEAARVGEKVVALTDTMNVTAMPDFTKKAKKVGIKPIVGCRLRMVDDITWRKVKGVRKGEQEYFLTWYVLSEKGMRALYKLLSLAHDKDHFYFTARLGFSELIETLKTLSVDDVAISFSDTYSAIRNAKCREIAQEISDALRASNVFVQIAPINTPFWDRQNYEALKLAKELGLSVLIARPVLHHKDKADALEIMTAVNRNVKISDGRHWSNYVRDLSAMTDAELVDEATAMCERILGRMSEDVSSLILDHSNERLAEMVKYEWAKQPVSLPKMAEDEFATLVEECKKGWKERFESEVFGHKPDAKELQETYKQRLAYELSVLRKLNFAGYFLLVQDVVRFAKTNGILVGPGRGSVGGSLVAYLMGITDCDPIRFGLLFERFINPDRIDLPDADLDFMSERRHEVIEYMVNKYGRERVANISNFVTLASASAIRDVSKSLGLNEFDYACSKLVPKKHGQPVELKEAADTVTEIAIFRDLHPTVWKNATSLQGVMRNFGVHAAGVVVAGVDLNERSVVDTRQGQSVINWDKRIVEDQGLVKMDILGLSTLDLINATLRMIFKRHGKKVDLSKIPIDDKKVLDNFAKAATVGVFQFESAGMRRLLRELGSDGNITFDDITAATALYRPGPMESGMMDSYFKRKQGLEDVEYDHPLMEPILKPTFGVMVYQEQVMQVARTIAGYSAPDADKLRKIMGKKLPEEMKKERGKFVDGCVATIGSDAEWAGELFDKIEGFAGYGFNKSHSVEYTLISWQCMWLKTYYAVEFFAAALTTMKDDRLPSLLKDAEHMGIEIDLPDINISTAEFEILTDTRLIIPFTRIKGLSDNTANAILKARKGGKFKSRADLETRVERRKCNIGHIEKLEKVGALASITPGSLPARHPDRIRDQAELIPGLITAIVPIDRSMHTDKFTKAKLGELVNEYREKHGPAGDGDGIPVKPCMGKSAKFMVIFDAPTNSEDTAGILTFGNGFPTVADALSEAGLTRSDAYWTSLIKRPKAGSSITPAEHKTYLPYLEREIELLKPTLIVLLGSTVVRHFIPGFKGKASEEAGKVVYDEKLDANILIGFNPGEVWFDPEKQIKLNEVFETAGRIVL
jgi:DNA polymerase III subunit alpha